MAKRRKNPVSDDRSRETVISLCSEIFTMCKDVCLKNEAEDIDMRLIDEISDVIDEVADGIEMIGRSIEGHLQ